MTAAEIRDVIADEYLVTYRDAAAALNYVNDVLSNMTFRPSNMRRTLIMLVFEYRDSVK